MIISWIHTLILTHVSDVETAAVGAMVGGPAQQELVAGGGQAEGGFNVAAERRHALAVDVGPWTGTQKCLLFILNGLLRRRKWQDFLLWHQTDPEVLH